MKIAKKLLALTVVLAMVLGLTATTVAASSDVRVVVDGVEVQFEGQGPVMVSGRVFAPVRGVFDQMGFDVAWNGSTRVATLTGDVTVVIPADGAHFYVDGETVTPVVPQLMLNGRLLLPLAAIAEAVGATAAWDPGTRTATITTAVDVDEDVVEDEPADDEDVNGDDEDVNGDDEDVNDDDEDVNDDDEDVNDDEDEDENGDDEDEENDDEDEEDDDEDEENDEDDDENGDDEEDDVE